MTKPDRVSEFSTLYTLHKQQLQGFARSLIPNRADAEDVLQRSSVVLWAKFDQYEPGTNFMAWAVRVVHLEAQKQRRRYSRDRHRFGDAFLEAVARQAVDENLVAQQQARERVLAMCLSTLGAEARGLLHARYVDGVETEQLAATFRRSVDGIYKALSRLRRALRDCVNAKAVAAQEEV